MASTAITAKMQPNKSNRQGNQPVGPNGSLQSKAYCKKSLSWKKCASKESLTDFCKSQGSTQKKNSVAPGLASDTSPMGRFLSLRNQRKRGDKIQTADYMPSCRSTPESESCSATTRRNPSSFLHESSKVFTANRRNESNLLPIRSINEMIVKSSDVGPSLHQLEIPSCDDFLVYSRVCSIIESYRIVDKNFDFSSLAGLSRMGLNSIRQRSAPISFTNGGNKEWVETGPFFDSHRAIVNSLLECAEDLVVERFFRESSEENNCIEVAVFSSQKRQQIILSFRGSNEQQIKPVKNKNAKQKEEGGGVSFLHPDYPIPVHPAVRDAYFTNNMEEKIFAALHDLTSDNLSFEVVNTGYSFGATLAAICALRYASLCPTVRVSCNVFGSPRIGGMPFRKFVNSLSNLKVMRVELNQDPWVLMPEGTKWAHAGHSIVVNSLLSSSGGSNDTHKKDSFRSSVSAYRFNNRRPSGGGNFWTNVAKKGNNKHDHGIRTYVHAIEEFTHTGLPWVSSYIGDDDGGVSGLICEGRHVV